MSCLHLEGAVLSPQVDRMADARDTSLVDHLCSFRACDVEFEVGVLLPVSEEERELGKEAIVGVSEGREGLRARAAVQAAFKRLSSVDELLPVLETIGIGFLQDLLLACSLPKEKHSGRKVSTVPLPRCAFAQRRTPHRSRHSDRTRSCSGNGSV